MQGANAVEQTMITLNKVDKFLKMDQHSYRAVTMSEYNLQLSFFSDIISSNDVRKFRSPNDVNLESHLCLICLEEIKIECSKTHVSIYKNKISLRTPTYRQPNLRDARSVVSIKAAKTLCIVFCIYISLNKYSAFVFSL